MQRHRPTKSDQERKINLHRPARMARKPFEFENGDKNSFTLSIKSIGSEAEAKQLFDAMQTASEYLHKTVTVCGKDELEGLCGM